MTLFSWEYQSTAIMILHKERKLLQLQISFWWNVYQSPTCFILSCCTRLWAIVIVDVLSQYKLIVSFCLKPKSDSTFLVHKSSHTPSVMPMNYASALNLATTCYFLLIQVTRFPPTKVKYLEVDLLSSFEPAKSASVYPYTFKFTWFMNKIVGAVKSFKGERFVHMGSNGSPKIMFLRLIFTRRSHQKYSNK